MNVLTIGAAGYVGSILRPTFERFHTCRYFDMAPIPGAEGRAMVGDVNDEEALARACAGMDTLVYLAMGGRADRVSRPILIDSNFAVNVCGYYRALNAAMRAGVRRVVLASSLSVYRNLSGGPHPLNESNPPDAMEPYGFSKRVAEFTNEAFARAYRDASFLGLRLMWPRTEKDWPGNEYKPGLTWYPIGPEDLRSLFLSALDFHRPGAWAVQATGDIGNDVYPNLRAIELLGWRPEGR